MSRNDNGVLLCGTELARRLEQAEAATTRQYVAAAAALRPEAGCTSLPIGDGVAIFAGARSPINRVMALGMEAPVDQAMLANCTLFFAEWGELARIDLCPLAHPSLVQMLQQNRYTVAQFKHVFVRGLATWPGLDSLAAGVDVAPIDDEEADLWAQTVAGAFHGGAPDAADLDIAHPNAHKRDTRCFLARIAGAPAGGGALAIHGGVAICYSASVRPEMRRMGVQHALLHARLRYAKEQGCNLVMAQTTPGSASQRNIERFGFQIAYTKPTMLGPLPG
jgi:GNAT superfamily N-acetyltransferase